MTQSLASAQIHRGLEINNSCDGIIHILIVGYVCYITITGGSSQHSAIVLFDLYVKITNFINYIINIQSYQNTNKIHISFK